MPIDWPYYTVQTQTFYMYISFSNPRDRSAIRKIILFAPTPGGANKNTPAKVTVITGTSDYSSSDYMRWYLYRSGFPPCICNTAGALRPLPLLITALLESRAVIRSAPCGRRYGYLMCKNQARFQTSSDQCSRHIYCQGTLAVMINI